jgi:hypothetical protein
MRRLYVFLCSTGQTICDKFLRLFERKQFIQKNEISNTFSQKVSGIKERHFERGLESAGRTMTWHQFMGTPITGPQELTVKLLPRATIGLAAFMLASATTGFAAPVKAPPLPAGSEKLQMKPGTNPIELKRDKNAHRRPAKDKTRDDTLPKPVEPAATAVTSK